MTVQQLLGALTAPELTEWQAYFALESERDQPRQQTPEEQVSMLLAMEKATAHAHA
jgi:hypothetical protein